MMKSCLGFGDLDLIFKVTVGLKLPNLSQKVLVCTISHWLADFNQMCMDITLEHDEELIWFGDLELFFKVSAELKLPNLSQKVIVCTISREPAGRF